MNQLFYITASWKTASGNIRSWSGEWTGPDATTVRDAAADYLRNDKRRRIARGLSVTATLVR